MKSTVLALSLALLAGCATLSDVTHEAEESVEVVDEAADKLGLVVKSLRAEVAPYAQLSASLCASTPVDPGVCAELEALAQKLARALDDAQAALDMYKAGKADFISAYEAALDALELAEDYASKVVSLAERARA